ncbi:MAG: 2-oxo acid dehydrogenase subunit E2, partial [Acidimicrobiales bacterium]
PPPPPPPLAPATRLGQAEPGVHPLRGIRRATARAMDTSWSTIPHVTAMNEIDASALLAARASLREAAAPTGVNVTPLAIMMVAVARALRRYPLVNATLDLAGETITVHGRVGISVAVASEQGLMVPVVADADRLGVLAMAAEVARLSEAARTGTVTAAELAGSTFTVTNYGSNGGYFAAPIIRPGESGIMGFGAIAARPFVVDDRVEARPVLPIVMSADHRLVDGDLLSAFHECVASALSDPVTLLL